VIHKEGALQFHAFPKHANLHECRVALEIKESQLINLVCNVFRTLLRNSSFPDFCMFF
jgi:hypothetical protein